MKNNFLSLFLTFFAVLVIFFNITLLQSREVFEISSDSVVFAFGNDDEEDKSVECVLKGGTIGEKTACSPGNSDCTPTFCSSDEF